MVVCSCIDVSICVVVIMSGWHFDGEQGIAGRLGQQAEGLLCTSGSSSSFLCTLGMFLSLVGRSWW